MRAWIDLLSSAGIERRLALTFSLSSVVIRASRLAIAERHGELDDVGVRLLWAELHYGKELSDKVRRRLGRP
jgi:hypothetical protein